MTVEDMICGKWSVFHTYDKCSNPLKSILGRTFLKPCGGHVFSNCHILGSSHSAQSIQSYPNFLFGRALFHRGTTMFPHTGRYQTNMYQPEEDEIRWVSWVIQTKFKLQSHIFCMTLYDMMTWWKSRCWWLWWGQSPTVEAEAEPGGFFGPSQEGLRRWS